LSAACNFQLDHLSFLWLIVWSKVVSYHASYFKQLYRIWEESKPLQRMWMTTFRSVQRHPDNWLLCLYSIQSTTVHEFTKVLVHKQPSLPQNLAEWYLQHCLRFLAAALMLFPLALATTSRVWSGRSYIYKIANWRSDNTLQASILSVAQKQS